MFFTGTSSMKFYVALFKLLNFSIGILKSSRLHTNGCEEDDSLKWLHIQSDTHGLFTFNPNNYRLGYSSIVVVRGLTEASGLLAC